MLSTNFNKAAISEVTGNVGVLKVKDNQHYISKAHLDKFIHPTSGQNVLYSYTKGVGEQRPRGTKQLASADHFYAQQESGTPTNKLDEARKFSETLYFQSGKRTSGPLAKCIYDDAFIPAASDKIVLAGAAAFLRCGSPVQIHNTAMMALLFHQQFLFNQLNTDEVKSEYKSRYGDESEKQLQDHRDELWKGRVFVDVGEENWKQLGFTSFEAEHLWISTLLQMGLAVCSCHRNSCFLTSDNPVILTCQSQDDSPSLSLNDAQVWFPISHNRGLLWTWKHKTIGKTTLGHSDTRVKNRNIIKWCYKDVYSPLREDWINAAVKEAIFDPCYGHYGSLEQVANNHSFNVIDADGKSREIVDTLAGLRSGEKCDILRLQSPGQFRQRSR